MIPLFQIAFKAGLREPPVQLICQSVTVDKEHLLWIDGLNAQDPIVVPLTAISSSRMPFEFAAYLEAHHDIAGKVLVAGAGEISPTIAARAIALMVQDPALSPETALEMVNEQALDLIEADHRSQVYFWGANGPVRTDQARGAAVA